MAWRMMSPWRTALQPYQKTTRSLLIACSSSKAWVPWTQWNGQGRHGRRAQLPPENPSRPSLLHRVHRVEALFSLSAVPVLQLLVGELGLRERRDAPEEERIVAT